MSKPQAVNLEITHSSIMQVCVCGDVFRASGSDTSVRRRFAKWDAKHKECTKPPYEARTYWLSFCDGEKPKGQQFLGACIVDITPEDVEEAALETMLKFPLAQPGAEYIGAALKKAHRLGCNPGGEVASAQLASDHPNLALYQRGVLMDRATIERIDREL